MKFSLAALLFVPLALAALPEQELTEDSVASGLVTSDVPKADGLNAAAYCPINYPYLCNGFCCPWNICCGLECCAPDTRYCSNGRCYR